MSNRLASEKSPDLLQHKDNPVDWWPWGVRLLQPPGQLIDQYFSQSGMRPSISAMSWSRSRLRMQEWLSC